MNGFTVYLALSPLAVIALVITFVSILPYRKEPPAKALLWYFACAAWFLAFNIAELLAPYRTLTLLFAKLEYIGQFLLPVAWLFFCLRYTGWNKYLSKGATMGLLSLPAVFVAIVFTNDWHRQYWASLTFLEIGPFAVIKATYGPLFWLAVAWAWSLIFFGCMLIIRSYAGGAKLVYRQSLWIVTGALLPAVTNLAFVFKLVPGMEKDFTPIGFAFAGTFFALGLYMYRLFWVMPVARAVLIQELATGIVALDAEGMVIDHNAAADAMLSLPAVLVGKRASELPALARALAAVEEIRQQGSDSQMARVAEAGRILEVRVKTLSWTGQAQGSVASFDDVTDTERMRRELDASRDRMARAEKLAALGQLTAGIAHEINNPLSYMRSDVRSLASLVKEGRIVAPGLEKELLAMVVAIEDGADRIEKVSRNLLSLARHDRERSALAPYDLNVGVRRILELYRGGFSGKISVETRFGAIPKVPAYGNEIEQVLLNLLSNATQAIEGSAEEGTIRVETAFAEGRVTVTVGNDGPPIPEGIRDRIFDPFYTTKSEESGTGLGLCVSREIVEKRHSGTLELACCDPVTFRLSLPVEFRDTLV